MAIALDCPHCGVAKVETSNDVWYIQGFLIFARYGSKTVYGCAPCVRSKTVGSLALSSVLGWWCFPWGLGTPFVMVQNVVAISTTNDDSGLRSLLQLQGLDYDDMLLDEKGRSAGSVRLGNAVMHTLHSMVWADGSADGSEVLEGVAIVSKMLGPDFFSAQEARDILGNPTAPPTGDANTLSPDSQLILMRAASAIAMADGTVDDSEVEELQRIGARLGLDSSITKRFVDALRAVDDGTRQEERIIAAAVLQVDPDAPANAIQEAYKLAMLDASQAEDPEERERRLEHLHAAYGALMVA